MDDVHRLIVAQIPHLRRYARALSREADAADELVQDCLTRAMDKLHLWQPDRSMRTWLFSILHNQYVNGVRRQANRPDRVALQPAHIDRTAVAPGQASNLTIRDMQQALDQLPDDQRQALLLIGLEEMKYREAADVLDVPMGTLMSRLDRGRRKLREIMESEGAASLRRVK